MIELKNIIDTLAESSTIIEKLSSGITQEQAEWKPDYDRWSLLEILNHLTDIETEDFRQNLNLVLFEPEKPWPTLDELEWIISKKYNERNLVNSMENFLKERNSSLQWLNSLENPDLMSKHRGDGTGGNNMHAGDLLVSWVAHDLFHIRQISLLKLEILKKWSAPFSPDYSGFQI